MIRFTVFNRWSGATQFTAEIDSEETAGVGIKAGLAAKWAIGAGADLRGAVLRHAVWRDAVPSGTDLRDAVLRHADLNGAVLSGVNLRGAVLREAALSGADLTGADLRETDLNAAVLSGALMRGTDLRGADLRHAVLSGALLSGADLADADLRGADLRGAQSLGDFTMPDGLPFSRYLREVVPALLTAGGKTIGEIVATGCWRCHAWQSCPIHAAFGIDSPDDAPPLLRGRINEFVQLFDAGLIPEPAAATTANGDGGVGALH